MLLTSMTRRREGLGLVAYRTRIAPATGYTGKLPEKPKLIDKVVAKG
jgi:hypothetical protein